MASYVADMAKVWVGGGRAQEASQAVLDALADAGIASGVPFGSLA